MDKECRPEDVTLIKDRFVYQMLAIPGVEEDSVLLLRGEGYGHVGLRPHVKWLHLHVGGVV